MLRKLYRLIFGGCDHEWTIIGKELLLSGPNSHFKRYHLQCKNCGDVIIKDTGEVS